MLHRLALAFIALAALSGCMTKPLDAQRRAQTRSVAVLSQAGSELSLAQFGVMVFGNAYSGPHAIPEWGLDHLIAHRIAQTLQGRYTVSELPPTAEFTPLNPDDIVRQARSRLVPGQADLVLLISRSVSRDFLHETRIGLGGIGLIRRQQIIGDAKLNAIAVYQIFVLDGRTFETLGKAQARMANDSDPPHARQPLDLWSPTFEAMSPAQRQQLRTVLAGLFDTSIPATLRAAGLLD